MVGLCVCVCVCVCWGGGVGWGMPVWYRVKGINTKNSKKYIYIVQFIRIKL